MRNMKKLTILAITMVVFWIAFSIATPFLAVTLDRMSLPQPVTVVVVLLVNVVGRIVMPLTAFVLVYWGARLAIRHELIARTQTES